MFAENGDEHKRQVSQIVAENQDMLESFSTVLKELGTLQNKLGVNSLDEVITDQFNF